MAGSTTRVTGWLPTRFGTRHVQGQRSLPVGLIARNGLFELPGLRSCRLELSDAERQLFDALLTTRGRLANVGNGRTAESHIVN